MDWGEIGKGSHPAQNPPPLEGGDLFAWNWYQQNCTGFAKEYQLMPYLLRRLRLDETAETMLLMRLRRIYDVMMRKKNKELAAVSEGEENG